MGNMSASDAAPLPRLGEVFFDVRGASRSMRLSWYASTGVAVFSIWQGGTCTGTFRLPIDDLPRMVEALHRGPHGQSAGQPESPPARAAQPAGPGRELRPAQLGTPAQLGSADETGQTTADIQLPQAGPGYGLDGGAPQRASELPAAGFGEPAPPHPGELPPVGYGLEPATGLQDQQFPAGYGEETPRRFGEEIPRGYGERPAGGYGGDPLGADYRPGGHTAYPDDPITGQERAPGRYEAHPLSAEYPAGPASRGYLEPGEQGNYPDPASTHGHRRDSPARPYVAPPRTSAEDSSGAPPRASRRRDADEPSPDSFPYGLPPDEPDPRQRRRYPGRH
jgi:hypothetical protein